MHCCFSHGSGNVKSWRWRATERTKPQTDNNAVSRLFIHYRFSFVVDDCFILATPKHKPEQHTPNIKHASKLDRFRRVSRTHPEQFWHKHGGRMSTNDGRMVFTNEKLWYTDKRETLVGGFVDILYECIIFNKCFRFGTIILIAVCNHVFVYNH